MKKFLQKIQEDINASKPVVMAFGRMNPPTIGHEKLVNRVQQIAKDYKAPHHIIISHSVDAKKNPLDVRRKLLHARRFFPGANIETSSKEQPTFLHHAARLNAIGHDHLVMVAGSDRIPEYEKKLQQYNGEGPGKLFNFKKIEVKSAGQRDPDAEGAEGMSASKMREHAQNNDFNTFKQGVPSHVPEKHARELFRDVRKGMGLNENCNRGMFKAIFVTGGPGSGKDVIIREAIAESKAVELNTTQAFDYLMDKQKLTEKTNDYRREAIRGRSPLIINGPADDHNRITRIREELEELGYETMIVFVDTTNEASKQRNERLTKMVAEAVRFDKWKLAQTCKESYRHKFNNFIDFDNSLGLDELEEGITDTYQKINTFIDSKDFNETAYLWLEGHSKFNINDSLFKENENVKKNSRLVERYKLKQQASSTGVYRKNSSVAPAAGPADITPDNRAGDSNADNIKWDGRKPRSTYTFRTYSEANQITLTKRPEPQESNFSKDKEKVKKKRFTDAPTVSQRMRNVAGIGQEFDTRQQGTVYPMSGLGDVTYREDFNDPGDTAMGVAGVLGGASNKEPMDSAKEKMNMTVEPLNKKKKK